MAEGLVTLKLELEDAFKDPASKLFPPCTAAEVRKPLNAFI